MTLEFFIKNFSVNFMQILSWYTTCIPVSQKMIILQNGSDSYGMNIKPTKRQTSDCFWYKKWNEPHGVEKTYSTSGVTTECNNSKRFSEIKNSFLANKINHQLHKCQFLQKSSQLILNCLKSQFCVYQA